MVPLIGKTKWPSEHFKHVRSEDIGHNQQSQLCLGYATLPRRWLFWAGALSIPAWLLLNESVLYIPKSPGLFSRNLSGTHHIVSACWRTEVPALIRTFLQTRHTQNSFWVQLTALQSTGLATQCTPLCESSDKCAAFFSGFWLTVILYLLNTFAMQEAMPVPGAVPALCY